MIFWPLLKSRADQIAFRSAIRIDLERSLLMLELEGPYAHDDVDPARTMLSSVILSLGTVVSDVDLNAPRIWDALVHGAKRVMHEHVRCLTH